MPKIGMEPQRRKALVRAAISEIGSKGSLEVTVSQIARRAGMSPALAHHYFGSKDNIFLAAMRHILKLYAEEVRTAVGRKTEPLDRVEAIIEASFSKSNFHPEVISAWLNFYVLAQTSRDAARLLRVYQRRLQSNLIANLRPQAGGRSETIAHGLAAMIDGQYIRAALRDETTDRSISERLVIDYLHMAMQQKVHQ